MPGRRPPPEPLSRALVLRGGPTRPPVFLRRNSSCPFKPFHSSRRWAGTFGSRNVSRRLHAKRTCPRASSPTTARNICAAPVVVLTKSDIATSPEELRLELESAAMGTPVLVTSAVSGEGVEAIAEQLRPARTGVLLGPSGAGKSSLINRIAGSALMKTRSVHRTGEGRHMTSHRELVQLPDGGMIIDTPGLREAQLWVGEDGLGSLFEDIEEIAAGCRFSDCDHRSEPGCAIKSAIAKGNLDEARLESYRKLQRELRSVAARSDARIRIEERRKWKQIAMSNKVRTKLLGR
ncbi:MAG: ribosome small subunit-dependent GTPase A [Chloroflexi bacterium]|nr:MAG: ribosome small subunit-dependent GTPase A [Chloroflexota bacterium]